MCAVLALSQPRLPDESARLKSPALAAMILVDVSPSTGQATFRWDEGALIGRLDAAKRFSRLWIVGGTLPDGTILPPRSTADGTDLIGLARFAAVPETLCPPTANHSAVLALLDQMRPAGVFETSTGIGDALAEGLSRLEKSPTPGRVMVLVTDGEHTRTPDADGTKPLTPGEGARLAGARGVPVFVIDTAGELPREASADERKGRLDAQATCETIARLSGGEVITAGDGPGLRRAAARLDELTRTPAVVPRYRRYREAAPWLAGVSAALCVFGTARYLRRRLRARMRVGDRGCFCTKGDDRKRGGGGGGINSS